jgi:fibronectin type 3 domain-containing protein/lysophospholipase L1-like esterase
MLLTQSARAQTRVACVGDSITYGVDLTGAGTATGQTYPGILQSLLGAGYNVQNYGHVGASLMALPTGNPSYHPVYTSTAEYTNSINFNPNIVIIMLGTNDASFAPNAGQTWNQSYQSLYISQYKQLIQNYQNCPAHPTVYVMACVRVTGSNQYGIDPTVVNTMINPADYTIATQASVPLIDAWTTSSPLGADYQDGVHPTAPLAQAIGQTVYTSITAATPATAGTPSSVSARSGNGSNTVSWTVPAGAVTSINIYRGTSPGGEGSTPYATAYPNRLTWFADTSVSNGTTYYYKVQAVNSAGASQLSSEVSARPSSSSYAGFPFSGSAQAIPGTIYDDTYDNGGAGVAYNTGTATWNVGGFDRYYDSVSLEQNSDSTSNGYDVGWNANGYTLNYTVNVATAGTYTVSFRVANGGTTAGSLHLQNASGTNLTGAVSIPASGGWQTWETLTANATLPAGVQTLTLVMDTASYNLNYMSFAAAGPPSAPSNLAATGGNAQVTLTWTAGTGQTSYNVYRGTSAGAEGSTPLATGITSTSYTDSSAANGTKYYYKVAAVNALGTSGMSNEASATPTMPTQYIANGTYTLTPQNATGSSVDATNGSTTSGTQLQIWTTTSGDINQEWIFTYKGNGQYLIQPAYDTALVIGVAGSGTANGTAVDIETNTGASNQLWTLTPATGGYTLTPGNAPSTTINVSGPSSANGTLIQIWQATGGSNTIFAFAAVTASAPAAPTGISASAGNTQVSITWTASSGATTYNVYRGTTAGGESSTPVATGVTSTSYTDIGLTNGTAYYYKVAAVNAAGTSSQSAEVSATPVSPIPIGHRIALKSAASGYYASSNQNDSTYLEAAWATTPGTWEYFDVRDAGNGYIALQSEQTGKYVTVDMNQASRVLRADWASTIGSWELFQWVPQGGSNVALKSVQSGYYVSCNLNDGDKLEAQWATTPQSWETFTWTDLGSH